MSKKIEYKCTEREDKNIPDNNYGCGTTTVVLNDGFDFGDFLQVRGFEFEHDSESDTYYVLEDWERTGEAFLIWSEEETEEEAE